MDIYIDKEFNSVISKKVKPEIFKAFGHLIIEINENLSQNSELAETVITEKASQIRKDLAKLIDSLERFAIEQTDQTKRKQESGNQLLEGPEAKRSRQS